MSEQSGDGGGEPDDPIAQAFMSIFDVDDFETETNPLVIEEEATEGQREARRQSNGEGGGNGPNDGIFVDMDTGIYFEAKEPEINPEPAQQQYDLFYSGLVDTDATSVGGSAGLTTATEQLENELQPSCTNQQFMTEGHQSAYPAEPNGFEQTAENKNELVNDVQDAYQFQEYTNETHRQALLPVPKLDILQQATAEIGMDDVVEGSFLSSDEDPLPSTPQQTYDLPGVERASGFNQGIQQTPISDFVTDIGTPLQTAGRSGRVLNSQQGKQEVPISGRRGRLSSVGKTDKPYSGPKRARQGGGPSWKNMSFDNPKTPSSNHHACLQGFSEIKPPSSFFKNGQPTRGIEVKMNASKLFNERKAHANHGQYSPTSNWRERPQSKSEKAKGYDENATWSLSASEDEGPNQQINSAVAKDGKSGNSKKKQIYKSLFGADSLSDEETPPKSGTGANQKPHNNPRVNPYGGSTPATPRPFSTPKPTGKASKEMMERKRTQPMPLSRITRNSKPFPSRRPEAIMISQIEAEQHMPSMIKSKVTKASAGRQAAGGPVTKGHVKENEGSRDDPVISKDNRNSKPRAYERKPTRTGESSKATKDKFKGNRLQINETKQDPPGGRQVALPFEPHMQRPNPNEYMILGGERMHNIPQAQGQHMLPRGPPHGPFPGFIPPPYEPGHQQGMFPPGAQMNIPADFNMLDQQSQRDVEEQFRRDMEHEMVKADLAAQGLCTMPMNNLAMGLPVPGLSFDATGPSAMGMDMADDDDILSFITDDTSLYGGPSSEDEDEVGEHGHRTPALQKLLPMQHDVFPDFGEKITPTGGVAPELVYIKQEPMSPTVKVEAKPLVKQEAGLCGPAPPGFFARPSHSNAFQPLAMPRASSGMKIEALHEPDTKGGSVSAGIPVDNSRGSTILGNPTLGLPSNPNVPGFMTFQEFQAAMPAVGNFSNLTLDHSLLGPPPGRYPAPVPSNSLNLMQPRMDANNFPMTMPAQGPAGMPMSMPAMMGPLMALPMPGSMSSASALVPVQPSTVVNPNKSGSICQFFLKGKCPFGDSCKFTHPQLPPHHPIRIREAIAQQCLVVHELMQHKYEERKRRYKVMLDQHLLATSNAVAMGLPAPPMPNHLLNPPVPPPPLPTLPGTRLAGGPPAIQPGAGLPPMAGVDDGPASITTPARDKDKAHGEEEGRRRRRRNYHTSDDEDDDDSYQRKKKKSSDEGESWEQALAAAKARLQVAGKIKPEEKGSEAPAAPHVECLGQARDNANESSENGTSQTPCGEPSDVKSESDKRIADIVYATTCFNEMESVITSPQEIKKPVAKPVIDDEQEEGQLDDDDDYENDVTQQQTESKISPVNE